MLTSFMASRMSNTIFSPSRSANVFPLSTPNATWATIRSTHWSRIGAQCAFNTPASHFDSFLKSSTPCSSCCFRSPSSSAASTSSLSLLGTNVDRISFMVLNRVSSLTAIPATLVCRLWTLAKSMSHSCRTCFQ